MALTGQQISANLYFNNLPVDFTQPRTYQWSVSSTNAFENWDPNAPGDGTPNQLVRLDPSDPDCQGKTQSFTFYDGVGGDTVSVTCTAHFTYTDGTPGTVKVTTSNVTFEKPTVTSWGITAGFVRISLNEWGYYNNPGDTVNTDGQSWHDIVVAIPSDFTAGEPGSFGFAQIITPSIKVHRNVVAGSNATDIFQLRYDGLPGLDAVFPYNQNGAGNPYPLPSPLTAHQEVDGDSPAFVPTSLSPTDGGGSNFDTQTVNEGFTTYLMYLPPKPSNAGASVWVPLQKYDWNWSLTLTATYDSYGDPPSLSETSASPLKPPTFTATNTDVPPAWTRVQTAPDVQGYVPGPHS